MSGQSRSLIGNSLSRRLFALTLLFVLGSEIILFFPALALFRISYLEHRLEAGRVAALAVEAASPGGLAPDVAADLLASAGIRSVKLIRDAGSALEISGDAYLPPVANLDLPSTGPVRALRDSLAAFSRPAGSTIMVTGRPPGARADLVTIVIDNDPLASALIELAERLFFLSVLVSAVTGALVFFALDRQVVSPLRRLASAIATFRANPEDARSITPPLRRSDELGLVSRELTDLQTELRDMLAQKSHLAALGLAVSKINHDLRGMLATAQILTDRLAGSQDQTVRRIGPTLFAAIDRAIGLATRTLKYGRAEEPPPSRSLVDLRSLIDALAAQLIPQPGLKGRISNQIPAGLLADADPDQLFRILMNLARNGLEAIESSGQLGEVRITAQDEGSSITIMIADTGPGMPASVQAHLFEPFQATGRDGGSGLGLAIARELTRAHGGDLVLVSTGPDGTVFRLSLPASEAIAA